MSKDTGDRHTVKASPKKIEAVLVSLAAGSSMVAVAILLAIMLSPPAKQVITTPTVDLTAAKDTKMSSVVPASRDVPSEKDLAIDPGVITTTQPVAPPVKAAAPVPVAPKPVVTNMVPPVPVHPVVTSSVVPAPIPAAQPQVSNAAPVSPPAPTPVVNKQPPQTRVQLTPAPAPTPTSQPSPQQPTPPVPQSPPPQQSPLPPPPQQSPPPQQHPPLKHHHHEKQDATLPGTVNSVKIQVAPPLQTVNFAAGHDGEFKHHDANKKSGHKSHDD